MTRALPLLVALAAIAAVIGPYLALGGASYDPAPVADPCETREWREPDGLQEALEQIFLSALDGTACDLGVSREDLVLALRDEDALDDFARDNGISRADAEDAIREGLLRAVEDAEEADAIGGTTASVARRLIESVPPWLVLEALETLRGVLP